MGQERDHVLGQVAARIESTPGNTEAARKRLERSRSLSPESRDHRYGEG